MSASHPFLPAGDRSGNLARPAPTSRRPRVDFVPVVLAAVGFGILVWALLPPGVAALNDDFGYYRSIVETLQHRRPWTDDWLEPWSASLSMISSLVYTATHRFSLATYGVLAGFAAVSFGTITRLCRARGMSEARSFAVATLLLLFPTLLWKEIEFTSMALYLPCLLLAIHAADRRAWGWFLIAWAAALSSRQSAVCWGVLPAIDVIRSVMGRRTLDAAAAKALAAIVVAAALFLTLRWSINETHAQRVLTSHVGEHIDWAAAGIVAALGTGVGIVALGLGGTLPPRTTRPSRAGRTTAVLLVACAAAVLVVGHARVGLEHPLFDGWLGPVYLSGLLVLAGIGAWRGFGVLRWEFVLTALASVSVIAIRGAAWDYYFIDAGLLCLFGAGPAGADRLPDHTTGTATVARSVLGAMAIASVAFAFQLKADVDRKYAWGVIAERALREGRLSPAELSFAPFGFTAWHLYPHYIEHEGRNSADLAGFGLYLRPGAIEVGQSYSKLLHALPQFRHEPPADRHNLVASGRTRYLGAFKAEYYLLRFKTTAEAPAAVDLATTGFRDSPFPLDDAEWTRLIRAAPEPTSANRPNRQTLPK